MEEGNISLADLLLDELKSNEGIILRIIDFFDKKYRLEDGTGLSVFKHVLARKKVRVNMLKDIDLRQDVSILKFVDSEDEEKTS